MTQPLSAPRLLLFGTISAGLVLGVAWLALPAKIDWAVSRPVVFAIVGVVAFVAGAWLEVRAHAAATRRFADSHSAKSTPGIGPRK